MEKLKKVVRGLIPELKRIVWPGPKKLASNMGATVSAILVFAAILFGFDKLGEALVRVVLSLI